MTPKQLRKFLDDAGLSQSGAARMIGITPRHMRRFIAGDAPVPLAIEYALRWVVSQQGSKRAATPVAGKRK
jgi:plasmid maintenance system antidote protein VapI